jgi:hypothetical protein
VILSSRYFLSKGDPESVMVKKVLILSGIASEGMDIETINIVDQECMGKG